jgi:hypothetical protein
VTRKELDTWSFEGRVDFCLTWAAKPVYC